MSSFFGGLIFLSYFCGLLNFKNLLSIMFDSSKLKELEDHKLISITWKDDWGEVVAYDFVFNEGQVFMQSSNNGMIFVCNYTDMRINRMRNYKDIKRCTRQYNAFN